MPVLCSYLRVGCGAKLTCSRNFGGYRRHVHAKREFPLWPLRNAGNAIKTFQNSMKISPSFPNRISFVKRFFSHTKINVTLSALIVNHGVNLIERDYQRDNFPHQASRFMTVLLSKAVRKLNAHRNCNFAHARMYRAFNYHPLIAMLRGPRTIACSRINKLFLYSHRSLPRDWRWERCRAAV